MESKNNSIITALDDIKRNVTINKYPSNKTSKMHFSLPDYIDGVVTERYLMVKHNLTLTEARFITNNLKDCVHIQPSKGHAVVVGNPEYDTNVVIVNTTSYGVFRIHGKRKTHCIDPKDIDSTLTSYVCAHGITAFVHVYKSNKKHITSVYYGNKFDGLLKYVQLMVSSELYRTYITENNETKVTFKNGDYYESFGTRA